MHPQHKKKFEFSKDNASKIASLLNNYPDKQSALLPVLDLAQRQEGWISDEIIAHIADCLGLSAMHVREVASFYSMFNCSPVGKYLVQICRTTPCWLCGSEAIKRALMETLGIGIGETTADGMFTLKEVECLGACVDAPVVQINDEYHERLNEAQIISIIKHLAGHKN